jgi:hypothetical protein
MTERRTFKLPGQSAGEGLVCKDCGCRDFRVVNSYPFQGGQKPRRRQCRHCGRIVNTREVIIDDDETTDQPLS